jgi:hypothetical protein
MRDNELKRCMALQQILSSESAMIARTRVCSTLVAAIAVVSSATGADAIDCTQGYQRVQGQLIATPYCQDEYLAQVARQYGVKASAAQLRNNPNFKKEVCRTVFSDIRVQTTCMDAGVPEHFGGGGR